MPHAIKARLGWVHACLCVGLILALTSFVGAQQPVHIEADGEGVWRLTTTLMGQADRLEWSAEMNERPDIEWQNNREFITIEWVVRSDDRPSLGTWVLMRSVDGQTESVELTVDPALEVIGPVGAGMTLWRIGSEWLAAWDEEMAAGVSVDTERSPPSMPEWLDQIMQANPQAFETDQPSSLMRGAMLRHPTTRIVRDSRSSDSVAAERPLVSQTPISEIDSAGPMSEEGGQEAVREEAVSQEALSLEDALDEEVLSTDLSSTSPSMDNDPQAFMSAEDIVGPAVTEPRWFAFDFIDQPQWWQQPHQLGRVMFVVGLVVIGVMILQIFSKVGGAGRMNEAGLAQASDSVGNRPTSMTPEAVSMTFGLAQRYVQLGEPTQALHWIDEVMAYGSPKQIREAKRLKRDALAALNHGHE